jgi:hypothetical protein
VLVICPQGKYGANIRICPHISYIDLFQALTFILQNKIFERANGEIFVQLANIFVSSLVEDEVQGQYNHNRFILIDYYMTFSILALVSARDCHIKPDSAAGGLIWVES